MQGQGQGRQGEGKVNLDEIAKRIRDAEAAMSAALAAEVFRIPEGPPPPPVPVPWRLRLRWWWYGVREWIAVKVLRVEIRGGSEEEW